MKKINQSLFLLAILISNSILGQSIANYDISLTTIWNSTNHTSVPDGAHWSSLVGATHNIANEFLELGVVLPMTNGIKDIAEAGDSFNFNGEVNTAITANKADQYIDAGSIGTAIGTFLINSLQVNENFSLITLVSMVAPSPDWIIAVNSIDLRSGNNSIYNGWKDTFTIDVFAYDAGTDDGTNYTSVNTISTPRVGVFKITGVPINGNKMGTLTFTYNSSTLNTSTIKSIESIKVFPNPTNEKITISNTQNIDLKSIEVYNIFGHLVKGVSLNNRINKLEIDLSTLNKGIYLLHLKTLNGSTKTDKLIIN